MLSNPSQAIKTLYNNWAKKIYLSIISAETILLIFDLVVIISDANTGPKHQSEAVHSCYVFLEWVQAAINLIIISCYALLFIQFLLMMRKNRLQYGQLWKQVIGFFTIILSLLIGNFVCDMVFYVQFDSGEDEKTRVEQEHLVSTVTYIHCSMEILLIIVFLAFTISQASESPQDDH